MNIPIIGRDRIINLSREEKDQVGGAIKNLNIKEQIFHQMALSLYMSLASFLQSGSDRNTVELQMRDLSKTLLAKHGLPIESNVSFNVQKGIMVIPAPKKEDKK